jgi:anaerobic selenocysteine-containing dehydrogenase/NADPH-dependent glutamate synthase beta subunit-like oxidoreductase
VKIEEDRTDPRVDQISPHPVPPCTIACPANLDALGYITLMAEGKYKEALSLIKNDLPLPGVIGRICTHPCETECNRGLIDQSVSICSLKRFVADQAHDEEPPLPSETGKERVAIIGSGPAGLSCAYYLAKEGYSVTIFEALPIPGGMLSVGIPDFRLPRKILEAEINSIRRLGVEIRTNTSVGNDLTLDHLFHQGFKAVFIAVGAHRSQRLGIPGEDLDGVLPGTVFLRELNSGKKVKIGKKVAIIGGGNVAIDASRCALRLGSQALLLYRRSREEMPAMNEEVEAAEAEGLKIEYLTTPVEILSKNGKVKGVRCLRMELGPPDASGRRGSFPIQGSDFSINADTVIAAIGETPDLSFLSRDSGLEMTPQGALVIDPITLTTTYDGVFAGGDVRKWPGTAIEAIADGKAAAISIIRYLNGEDIKAGRGLEKGRISDYKYIPDYHREIRPREEMGLLSFEKRKETFEEVKLGFTEEGAILEAGRCFRCGCPRRAGAEEFIYHPDRVRFPLKRIGERGENKWQRITWEQALDEIADQLKNIKERYGPESLMITSGTGRTTMWAQWRFLNLFGSPNSVGEGNVCYGPAMASAASILGWTLRHRTSLLIERGPDGKPLSKSILLIGINPQQAYLRLWKSVQDAKKLGTKIIVIDPRKTRMAELADLYLQPRPATDTALLLGMVNVIVEEGLFDKEFVQKWCYGFDKLVEHVKQYPPDRVAEITWVPAYQIRKAARMYATERPGMSVHGMGMEHLEYNNEAMHAKLILSAIVGNIDVEGGDYMTGPADCISGGELALNKMLSPNQKKKQIGADRFKLLALPGRDLMWEHIEKLWGKKCTLLAYAHYPLLLRAILTGKPYPVRAGITFASNPMLTQANVKLVYQALKSLDLYVVHDFWLTPSALLADYVLPAACWLERPQLEPVMADTQIMGGEAALPAVVPGEHEYWTDYEFFRGLGIRVGQEEFWPWETLEEVCDYILKPMGMSFREFMEKKDGVHFPPNEYKKYLRLGGFGTPTGKLEIYSTVLEKLGYDPLPYYEEAKESPISRPELAKDYPLMLITGGRFQPYFHSEHRQVESVRRRHPEPCVQIHPETAKGLGIENGDWAWIETPRGRIRQKCTYFDGIHPRVVHCQHGWWFPELPSEEPWLGGVWESNVNVLTDDDPDRCNPESGVWPLKTALCKVYKCKTYI